MHAVVPSTVQLMLPDSHAESQEPLTHSSPAAHLVPHAPQLPASLSVFVQPESQRVGSSEGQVSGSQLPAVQDSPSPHGLPQRPQCSSFASTSVQPPPQSR